MIDYIIAGYLLISLITLIFLVRKIENNGGPRAVSNKFNLPIWSIILAPFAIALAWPVYLGVRVYAYFNFKGEEVESPNKIINQMEEDF